MATNIVQIYLLLRDHYVRFLHKLSVSTFVPLQPTQQSIFNPSGPVTTPQFFKINQNPSLALHFIPHHSSEWLCVIWLLSPLLTLSHHSPLISLYSLYCVYYSSSTTNLFQPQVLCMSCSLCLALLHTRNAHLLTFTVSFMSVLVPLALPPISRWCCFTS